MKEMKRTAEISECGKYRWWLQRRWDEGGAIVCFVMLNPSTADGEQDDPTIRRCIGYARSWGFGALSVRNLYPYRATKPKDLFAAMKVMDCSGGIRGAEELRASMTADLVIAAWGGHATFGAQDRFLNLTAAKPIYHLGKTGDGKPVHPLFQPANLMPEPWRRCNNKNWIRALSEAKEMPYLDIKCDHQGGDEYNCVICRKEPS